jgi:hypothetical protein
MLGPSSSGLASGLALGLEEAFPLVGLVEQVGQAIDRALLGLLPCFHRAAYSWEVGLEVRRLEEEHSDPSGLAVGLDHLAFQEEGQQAFVVVAFPLGAYLGGYPSGA